MSRIDIRRLRVHSMIRTVPEAHVAGRSVVGTPPGLNMGAPT